MPELPEVEVVKKSLERSITNLTIRKVKINNNNLRYKINNSKFNKLKGKKVISVKRRSKYILINLSNKKTLIIHLGMTGKFFILNQKNKYKRLSFYYESKNKKGKHDHLIFHFNKKIKLVYNDIRRFGFMKVLITKKLDINPHFALLGPEPLSNKFNENYFKSKIFNKEKCVKDLLMDQKFVGGLGNIYVNEILFKSNVHPKKKIYKIDQSKIRDIINNTKLILKKAINLGGSSIKDFEYDNKKKGKFQELFNVYDRKGQKCSKVNCKAIIRKIYLSQRSSYFCNRCQK